MIKTLGESILTFPSFFSQSVKTTSKSVVANASKILQVSLEVIDNLVWSDDDVTALVSQKFIPLNIEHEKFSFNFQFFYMSHCF